MPAKSRKQQRYLFATKGAAWVKRHHFDTLDLSGVTEAANRKLKRGKKGWPE